MIDHVLTRDWRGRQVTLLQGNHGEVLLLTLDGNAEATRFWLRIGGAETMQSYGTPRELIDHASVRDISEDFLAKVPPTHATALNRMADRLTVGDYHFVLAAIRPGVPLDSQTPEDLRWIGECFLGYRGCHDAMMVHGHSIGLEVEEVPNRIGIDTGSFKPAS